jgi:hypothetical protein
MESNAGGLMKHDVHIFAVVRVKCADIEAESHDDAVKKAMEQFHDLYDLFETRNLRQLPEGVTDVEFGEEFSHFLTDEAKDPEFTRSTWHDAMGTERRNHEIGRTALSLL